MRNDVVGKQLVAEFREAIAEHRKAWALLVPDKEVVNADAEPLEEVAYQQMVKAKAALRQHIIDCYGVDALELAQLFSV